MGAAAAGDQGGAELAGDQRQVTVQYSTVQYSTVQYSTAPATQPLVSMLQVTTVPYSTVQPLVSMLQL